MLVIDASALIEVLTTDPVDIPDLAARVHAAEWMNAPDLIDYEVLNVLRKMVARSDIEPELAEESRLALRNLRLTRHPVTDEITDRMWELRHNVSACDASYVALAEHLEMPLVTGERRLADGVQKLTSIEIESYAVDNLADTQDASQQRAATSMVKGSFCGPDRRFDGVFTIEVLFGY